MWWNFDVDDKTNERFAIIFNNDGNVCDWTRVLTKLLCSYATHIGVWYNTDVDTFMEKMLKSTRGCKGYARYMRLLILSYFNKAAQPQEYDADVLESFNKHISGCNTPPLIYTWFLQICGYESGTLPHNPEYIVRAVEDMIMSYKRSNSAPFKFRQQVAIAILAGTDALNLLEHRWDLVYRTRVVRTHPTRLEAMLLPSSSSEEINSRLSVTLDDLSRQILNAYGDNLSADTYSTVTMDALSNMFIHNLGKDLIKNE